MYKKTTFILFFSSIVFSQVKNEAAFNFAITNSMGNSPSLIPITVVDKKTKNEKFYLTNVESLFWATELECEIKNVDSLKNIILRNSSSQTFEFKKKEALETIEFYKKKSIDIIQINKIYKLIKRKKIIKGIENLKNQISINHKLLDDFSVKRYEIKDSIIKAMPELTKQQIKFLDYLAFETYSPDYSINQFGNMVNFEGAENLLKLWKKATLNEWQLITKNLKKRDKIFEKYVTKYHKKYRNNYLVALFKYGVIFYVSDLNGELKLHEIVK